MYLYFLFCRVQRCAMLQFSEFHEKLLNTLCRKADDGQITEHAQSLVLDTLCWLAGVHSNGPGRLIIKILLNHWWLPFECYDWKFKMSLNVCYCFAAQKKEMRACFQKHENVSQTLYVFASLRQDEALPISVPDF